MPHNIKALVVLVVLIFSCQPIMAAGLELFDQEAYTTRENGYSAVIGAIYRIVTQSTLDFTTIGSPDNTAETVFICTAADTLGSGDELQDITAPNKSIPSIDPWPALAGSEVHTAANAASPTNETDATTGWTQSTMDTMESVSKGDEPIGTYSMHFVSGDAGDRSAISRTTTIGTLYRVSSQYIVVNGDGGSNFNFRVGESVNGLENYNGPALSDTSWSTTSFYFIATVATTWITVRESGSANDPDFYIDTLSIRPVQISWSPTGTNTIQIDETEDALLITYVDDNKGASLVLADSADLSSDLTIGRSYTFTFDAMVGAGDSVDVEATQSDDTELGSVTVTATSITSYELEFICTNATTDKIQMDNMGVGEDIYIRNLSLKAVSRGNNMWGIPRDLEWGLFKWGIPLE